MRHKHGLNSDLKIQSNTSLKQKNLFHSIKTKETKIKKKNTCKRTQI